MRSWTEQEEADGLRLRIEARARWRDVAAALGRTERAVIVRLSARCAAAVGRFKGQSSSTRKPVKWLEERLEWATRLIAAGASVRRAARTVGATRGQLAMALCTRGIRARDLRLAAAPQDATVAVD